MLLSKEDLHDAEDAWTDAVENYGPESDDAKDALAEYDRIRGEYFEQLDNEPEW